MNETKPEILQLSLDNFNINYLYYKGGKKNLILLHATGFLPWLWHPIAKKLI